MERYVLNHEEMKAYPEPLSACIGYFDGVHIGHQALVTTAIEAAKQRNIKSAMITFHPDPWVVLKDMKHVQHLTTLKDRQDIVEAMGIDVFIVINFTKSLAAMSKEDFFETILCQLNLEVLVYGFDFRFGYMGQGDTQYLKDIGSTCFTPIEVAEVKDDDVKISTTRITHLIQEGKMEEVTRLLKRPYGFGGIVVDGRKKGREIGFPTANLDILPEYIVPKLGVYIALATLNQRQFLAMVNIGHNPTFNTRSDVSVEAYLLDFNEMIYGQRLELKFVHRIRSELKFSSIQELIEQMNEDYRYTREYAHEFKLTEQF
ncbi:MAG TPA: bifunctional riboflavin kinase/FMN adenylyltransferase [Erysipelotrichaceae bacterium]|nr:bifunctional riboflavin kinase/FMN adenylyltransferase [Erysipelotrichaceae bacterium]